MGDLKNDWPKSQHPLKILILVNTKHILQKVFRNKNYNKWKLINSVI